MRWSGVFPSLYSAASISSQRLPQTNSNRRPDSFGNLKAIINKFFSFRRGLTLSVGMYPSDERIELRTVYRRRKDEAEFFHLQ